MYIDTSYGNVLKVYIGFRIDIKVFKYECVMIKKGLLLKKRVVTSPAHCAVPL
jgi:hypothetical protein